MRSILFSCLAAVLFACGGSTPAANDPSTTTSTAEPTSSDEPTCKAALESTPGGTDLASCLAECEKLDDTVPEGAKCIPPRVACTVHCKSTHEK